MPFVTPPDGAQLHYRVKDLTDPLSRRKPQVHEP
jgi:hypothetical protein